MIILRISIKVSLLKKKKEKKKIHTQCEFCKTFNLYIDRLPVLEVRYQRYICNMEYFYQILNCLCTHIFSYISIDSIIFCKDLCIRPCTGIVSFYGICMYKNKMFEILQLCIQFKKKKIPI